MLAVISCVVSSLWGHSQNLDSILARSIAASVYLDSVVIAATRQGFEVEDFIQLVKEDESLHEAFSNLRKISCHFESEMEFKNKKDRIKAGMTGIYNQQYDGTCRRLIDINEMDSGNYFKGSKRKLRYYTARLYDHVFVTHNDVCDHPGSAEGQQARGDAIESQTEELKKLIFSPGTKANIPFIGSKTELFSEDMWQYYDFSIKSDTFNGTPVYVFDATVKGDYVNKESKTVFKTLTTYFAKSDFQVLSRTYRLAYSTLIYMFDVTMYIDLVRIDGAYYPSYVKYDGTWNIPTKKRESGFFTVRFDTFIKEY